MNNTINSTDIRNFESVQQVRAEINSVLTSLDSTKDCFENHTTSEAVQTTSCSCFAYKKLAEKVELLKNGNIVSKIPLAELIERLFKNVLYLNAV